MSLSGRSLSALTDGAVSHDQVTRFLVSDDFDSKALWRLVNPLVRKVAKTGSTKRKVEHGGGVLIVDDTVEEKPYTAESELGGKPVAGGKYKSDKLWAIGG